MAQKKKTTKKKATTPPAKQKKAPAAKAKAAAKKVEEEAPKKKAAKSATKTSTTKKTSAETTKASAAKKSSAEIKKAATSKKITGTMATKETPSEPNDKNKDAIAKAKAIRAAEAEGLKIQVVGEETQIELDKRVESKNRLNELVNSKFIPMFSKVVTTTGKTKPATTESVKTAPTSNEAAAPAAFSAETKEFSAAEVKEVAIPEDAPKDSVEVVSVETKEKGGFSLFGLKFDFGKMEKDPFGELIDYLNEHTREPIKEETEEENEGPMVIVADFTLPYRCCEDYVCEDMCYTEDELASLEIPPFAKDDFAVTRKDTPVDIYPDMNDSHVFENYIVVKEIEENQSFATSIGGKVTTDKSGRRPHFTYTPPAGQAGVSDSFVYTLLNTVNKLSDTATVWIEVAEALPTFSMKKTTLCHNAEPVAIEVDPKTNEWSDIDVTGNGVIQDDSSGVPVWWFDPKDPNVVIGVNTVTLTLKGQNVSTIDVTVLEIKADYENRGQLINEAGGTGTIVFQDHSLNVQNYNWEWRIKPSGSLNTGSFTPDSKGTVSLPISNLPETPANFTLEVTLTATSPQGCIDLKPQDVAISWANPRFEVHLTDICFNAVAVALPIDPQGSDWDKIEVTVNNALPNGSNGLIKTVDGSGVPTWKFDPRQTNVSGQSTLRLMSNGEQMDMMVIETHYLQVELPEVGEMRYTDPEKPGGSVLLKQMTSAKTYHFKWKSKYGEGDMNLLPGKNGVFVLPFPDLPRNAETFVMTTTLTSTSVDGCVVTQKKDITVSENSSFEIIKRNLQNTSTLIADPGDFIKIGITQKMLDAMQEHVTAALANMQTDAGIKIIREGGFDSVINGLARVMDDMISKVPGEHGNPSPDYMSAMTSSLMASLGLLTIRNDDVNNANVFFTLDVIKNAFISRMFPIDKNQQVSSDFSQLFQGTNSRLDDRPLLKQAYLDIDAAYSQ